MTAKELIGKNAIRTQPIMEKVRVNNSGMLMIGDHFENQPNYCYTTESIKIVNATDSHIIAEVKSFMGDKTTTRILNCQYCDDNWIDYDELINPKAEK